MNFLVWISLLFLLAEAGVNTPERDDAAQHAPKVDVKSAEERDRSSLQNELKANARLIRRVENALEGGTPYLGTSASAVLFGELSSLRREKALLLEKDVRLQERANLLLSNEGDGNEDAKDSSENEDERILQRVDSFSILIVVSTLITGFSIPTIQEAQLDVTRMIMTLVFAFEMFATTFFSIISFYAKQAFNYGSTNNHRTARFLYHVRWITFSAQACYTAGFFLFLTGILLEATVGYEEYWALIGVFPILVLGVACYWISARALISLRMGMWTHNLLLFDADTKLIDGKRSAFIPAPTTFRGWLDRDKEDGSGSDSDENNPC